MEPRITPTTLISWQNVHGFTNEEASRQLGVTPRTFSRWRSGESKTPRWLEATMAGIAKSFKPVKPKRLPPLKLNERRVQFYTLQGVRLNSADRLALPEGSTYWEIGTAMGVEGWLDCADELRKSPRGYSDTYTGRSATLAEAGITPEQ